MLVIEKGCRCGGLRLWRGFGGTGGILLGFS